MAIEKQTRDQIVTSLKNTYDALVPGFDVQTEGSPEEDIFVKAPVYGALGRQFDAIAETSQLQTLEDPTLISETDLDGLLNGNEGFARKTAGKSKGYCTFNAVQLDADITIPDGTIVSTEGGTQFSVAGSYTMFASVKNSYYDGDSQRYKITVPIEAVLGGISGNVKIGVINQLVSPISGITSVRNSVVTAGGTLGETNTDYVERYKEAKRGLQITSFGGMIKAIDNPDNGFDTILDRLLVKAGDTLMERDEGLGGMVDIYILGGELQTVSQQFIYSTTTGKLEFEDKPVDSVSLVAGPVVETSTGTTQTVYEDYTFVKDTTSTVAGSVNSVDYITFADGNKPDDGEVITVTYTFNRLIKDLQTFFEEDDQNSPNSDILIKEGVEIESSIVLTISVEQSRVFDEVASTVAGTLATFVNTLILGEGYTRFDVVSVVADIDGVSNVDLDDVEIVSADGTITDNGDLEIESKEYTRITIDESGTPNITINNSLDT